MDEKTKKLIREETHRLHSELGEKMGGWTYVDRQRALKALLGRRATKEEKNEMLFTHLSLMQGKGDFELGQRELGEQCRKMMVHIDKLDVQGKKINGMEFNEDGSLKVPGQTDKYTRAIEACEKEIGRPLSERELIDMKARYDEWEATGFSHNFLSTY